MFGLTKNEDPELTMFAKAKLARPGLAVPVSDDNRHQLPNVALSRESSPYLLHLPDDGVAAFTYTWVNHVGEAGAALAIFGPAVGTEPIQQRLADRPVPANMDWSDWRIDTFSMKQDLKFGHADIRWATDAATIEFSFDAYHPPYAYSANAEGCPAYAATDRIEQSGYVKGQFILGGKTIPFDTVGHRDHSWGTRDWGTFQHYNWFEGQTEDGVSVHFWRFWALGRENLRGYVFKDGMLAEVTDVKSRVTFNKDLWQQKMVATVMDEAGRTTEVTCEFYAHYTLIPSDQLHLREGAARATYDGKPGVGWLEVAWPPSYLEHVASTGAH